MNARTLISFEEFEQYPDDDMRHELIDGDHVIRPPANIRESLIRHELHDSLNVHVTSHGIGRCYIAAGFLLSQQSWLQPDVSVVRAAQVQAADPDYYYRGAPAIAVEIAAESLLAEHLELKMNLYFEHGSEEVWVVYPQTRRVRVHTADGMSRTVASGELTSAALTWLVDRGRLAI